MAEILCLEGGLPWEGFEERSDAIRYSREARLLMLAYMGTMDVARLTVKAHAFYVGWAASDVPPEGFPEVECPLEAVLLEHKGKRFYAVYMKHDISLWEWKHEDLHAMWQAAKEYNQTPDKPS